ncbi:hypothetical protein [Usitatibacter palustris]|uniref:Uncharacterized protein n=1 Tax=Usitatibacter palustris TaxID=2732487 RepID=A0A6M4H9I2_9PROT|nr:hypothetical protein [Usitatibacter palustris]QJR15508.1 hypothetical protein DSM104440_02329 [Usitatibacter palustris]
MEMTLPNTERKAVDATALAQALSTFGLLYGSRDALHGAVADAADEADAVRKFIRREKPHLLASYDLDALVAMVLAARQGNLSAPASIEQYDPA